MRFPFPGARTAPVLLLVLLTACTASDDQPAASPSAVPTTTSPAPTATLPTATATPTTTAPTELPPTKPPVETPPPPGAPPCKPATLTLTDADYTEAEGHRHELFGLRTSGPDCGLQGYPTLELRDAAGRVIPVRWSKGGYGLEPARPEPVTLSSGTSVSFSVGSPASGSCVEAAKVRATLSGVGTLTAATSVRICGGVAGVSPIRRFEDDHTDEDGANH